MLMPPAIPGFDYIKESYEDLVARYLGLPGYVPELLGQSTGGRPIYGFALGDMTKPTMYVQGNIHGYHEWRTSWWVSEFMRLLVLPSLVPDHAGTLWDLRSRYSFYFIPSVNPDGYGTPTATGRYGNANGVSVSENFDFNWVDGIHAPPHDEYRGPAPWSEIEARIVRDKILDLKPVSVLCNHTWGSSNVGYTTRHPQNSDHDMAVSEFFDAVNAALGYGPEVTKKFSPKLATGSAYNWAGTLESSLGIPVIGQVWEAGGGLSPVDQARSGMTGILYHMLMVDAMLSDVAPLERMRATGWGPLNLGGVNYPVVGVDVQVDGVLNPVWP